MVFGKGGGDRGCLFIIYLFKVYVSSFYFVFGIVGGIGELERVKVKFCFRRVEFSGKEGFYLDTYISIYIISF